MKTKSEVIKLLKEGTHCIYNDCAEKLNILNDILSKSTDRETGVGGMHLYYWIGRNKARCLSNNRPELDIIPLSEIEPDNEKPMESKSVTIIKKHLKEQASSIFNDNEPLWDDIVDAVNEALETESGIQPDPNHDKPYLYFEGEKYYFGEEYEFSDHSFERYEGVLRGYISNHNHPFKTNKDEYRRIHKIDHTSKYKKQLEELKEQALKDGVNLKELI